MRSCIGQSGHGVSGERSSGGFGMISNWCTETGFCRWQVPRQSAPGVAASDYYYALASGQNLYLGIDGVAEIAPVLLRQELHREMDSFQFASRNI